MADIRYALVGSAIRLRGKQVTVADKYTVPSVSTSLEDLQVELVHHAAAAPSRTIHTGKAKGDQEFNVILTPDGRLQSINYKTTGIGGAVITAGAKVLAFVGAVVQAAARAGKLAGQSSTPDSPDPRAAWADEHAEEATQLAANRTLATVAAAKLTDVRRQMVAEEGLVKLRNLAAREKTLDATLQTLRQEIGRIEELYRVWRDQQRHTVSALIERVVEVARLPLHEKSVPDISALQGDVLDLWKDFGVLVEVVDAKRLEGSTDAGGDNVNAKMIGWRIARPIELWVWKRVVPEIPQLVSRSLVRVVDTHSDMHGMEVQTSIFGEHGGSWTFNDDGSPATLNVHHESAVGAFANALAGVPGALAESVGHAAKLRDDWSGIEDAAAEREKAAAERDLATAKARLETVGLHATAEDFAALQRAEQAAKLRTARRGTSAAADQVDDVKTQLELVTTQNKLASERRASVLETELAQMKAEVAQLDLEVKKAKALFNRDHPAHEEEQ
jgi:hypothetical protein